MKKSLILLASALFVLLGCQTNRNDHQGKTVFRYNEASGISSLDPAFARGQADVWACNQIYNGLLQLDDSLRIKPCIAKRFTISEDGLEYRFTLRNDVFFQHNEAFSGGIGRAVTAHDFVYSFNRILDPKTLSPGTWVFNQVLRDPDGKPHVVAIDDTTLNIRLAKPFPPFLGLLTMQYCSVVPKEAVEKYGKEFRKNPVGTGPFKLFYWEERVGLVLHKNDNYFEIENGVRLPLVDAVSVTFLSDKQAAFMEFVKGKLDFISGIDASYKDELLDRDGNLKEKYRTAFQMRKAPYLNTEYLGILMDSKSEVNPLTNVLIRKAINHGFDRERMIRFLRNGIGTPGIYGMVPPGMPGFDFSKVKGYHYDPSLAASYLTQAGYPGGKGLPEITLSTTKEYQDLCEYIQGQLGELGIRIKIDVNQGATHREMVARQKLDFFRGSWIADYPDAENYLALFYGPNHAPAGPNYTHFGSQTFDSLFKSVIMNTNEVERNEKYLLMDQMAMNDAPVVVLYYDLVIRLQANHVSGLSMNAMNLLSLKRVQVKE